MIKRKFYDVKYFLKNLESMENGSEKKGRFNQLYFGLTKYGIGSSIPAI